MIDVDGVEGVDQLVAHDIADLLFYVVRVPIDDVSGAVEAQLSLILLTCCCRDDGAKAGQSADLDGVLPAVAPCADNDDRFFAIVERLASVDGTTGKREREVESVGAEDRPEGRNNVADERCTVVVR